jgi:hypothetical protein
MILGIPHNRAPLDPSDDASVWGIFCRSFQTARRYPKLLVFPLAATLLLLARRLSAIAHAPKARLVETLQSSLPSSHPLLIAIAYRPAITFLAIFFLAALYHELPRVYANERPSLFRGVSFACNRIGPIASWSLVWSLMEIIRQFGLGHLGSWPRPFFNLGAGAWFLTSMFAIPVLLRERILNPIAVMRDSWVMIRQTWRQLIGLFLSLSLGGVFFMVCTNLLLHFAPRSSFNHIAISVWILGYYVALYMMTNIYLCALYIYAAEGVMPNPLWSNDLDGAWEIKTR